MRAIFALLALASFAAFAGMTPATAGTMSDAQVRQAIIKASIDSYPGSCPCPYNSARNGSACGRRSAYSRPGGYAPKCFASDVSKADVEAYRQAHETR